MPSKLRGKLRRAWRDLQKGTPGARFERRYEKRHRARRGRGRTVLTFAS
jgi:hypothetical protein